MANQYFLKDKKIDIYESQTVYVMGVPKTEYVKIYANLWAYYKQLSGGSSIVDSNTIRVYDNTERVTFVINYIADIRAKSVSKMVIKYNGRIYEMKLIDDYEGYKNNLKITAEYNSGGSYPGTEDDETQNT